jgi:flavin-dependent dehydrogenase
MNVAIVGAGPAGSLAAWALARDGARVTLFDPSHPREKPCGGGLTAKALALLPAAPADDPLPARPASACRFESGDGEGLDLQLARPVAIAARAELDAWLLRRAVQAGATHRAERVIEVTAEGGLRTAAGQHARFHAVLGADGAGSLVRRTFLGPLPAERRFMAVGWRVAGDSPMLVRFTPGLDGYLWLFPRHGHVAVGIAAPLRSVPTAALLARLEREVARDFPELAEPPGARYAHTIPAPGRDAASILETGAERWALLGDAGGFADPITGEGIFYALRSGLLAARTLRETGSLATYPARVLEDFGHDLLRAAALQGRFYEPGFARRMLRYARVSPAIRQVLQDLVLGEQGYVGLKRRLLGALPRLAWDRLRAQAHFPTAAARAAR